MNGKHRKLENKWAYRQCSRREHRSAAPDEDDEGEDDEVGDPYLLPVTHEVAFEGVSALLTACRHGYRKGPRGSIEHEWWKGLDGPMCCAACAKCGALRAGHEKLVTALDVDRAGARALTGGEDYQLRMFDFGGMKRDMRAFRKLEPSDGYPVNAVSFSPTGD